MAEQFLTRRERREAERRAAEAAFEEAKRAQESAPSPAAGGTESSAEVVAPAPSSSPAAVEAPVEVIPEEELTDPTEPEFKPAEPVEPQVSAETPETLKPPEPEPAKPEDVESAKPEEAPEPPQFATRAERKAWMREHGLLVETSDLPVVEEAPEEQAPEEAKAPATQPVPQAKEPAPQKVKEPVKEPEPAKEQVKEPEPAKEQVKEPVKEQVKAPAPQPAPPPFVAPARPRKAPVVKPPHTEGIRVVTGSVPVAKEDVQIPPAETSAPVSRKELRQREDQSGITDRIRTVADSAPATEAEDDESDVTREEWPLPNIGGEEPAGPMPARSVTHQDGEILVGDRPSILPYVVLGVGGLCAIVLIVIALLMLF